MTKFLLTMFFQSIKEVINISLIILNIFGLKYTDNYGYFVPGTIFG